MPKCKNCKKIFPNKIKDLDGQIYNLSGRKFCPDCSAIGSRNTRSYIVELKKNESFCVRCQKVKNKEEFYIRKSSGRPFSYCMECQKDVKELKFREKLEILINYYGGVCQDCQLLYPTPVYEFYSNNKIFQLNKARNMSIQRLLKDLNGFILLCKNCSAIRKWECND
jgi:hypothetical protein